MKTDSPSACDVATAAAEQLLVAWWLSQCDTLPRDKAGWRWLSISSWCFGAAEFAYLMGLEDAYELFGSAAVQAHARLSYLRHAPMH